MKVNKAEEKQRTWNNEKWREKTKEEMQEKKHKIIDLSIFKQSVH